MSRLLLKDGILITQNPNREIYSGNILMNDGIIVEMGDKVGSINTADKVIDAHGYYICPGFVSTHLHLGLPSFDKSQEIHSSIDLLQFYVNSNREKYLQTVESGLLNLLKSGITTTLIMESSEYFLDLLQLVKRNKNRCFLGNFLLDYGERYEELQNTAENINNLVREIIPQFNQADRNRIGFVLSPWSIPLCSGHLWGTIANLSNEFNMLIQTHLSETKEEQRSIKHGRSSDSIQYLDRFDLADRNLILAHCVWLTEKDMDLIQQGEINIVHCPSSNDYFHVGKAPLIELIQRGINISLGLDGTFCNPQLDMFFEMKKCVEIFGLDSIHSQKIFDMATINGAKALGMQDKIGSIEIGKKADLVLLKLPSETGDPIKEIVKNGNRDWIHPVILNGEILSVV